MIIFDKIIPKNNKISILRFKNELGSIVDIPLDVFVANTISLHLNILSGSSSSVERGNIEDSENSD